MHIDRVFKTAQVPDANAHHTTSQAAAPADAPHHETTADTCVSLSHTPPFVSDPSWDVDTTQVSHIQSQVANGTLFLDTDSIAAALMAEIIHFS